MSKQEIDINLNDKTIRPSGATPPPEKRGGVGAGATAQDQNFEELGQGIGDTFVSPEFLNLLSILADTSTTIRKVFLPLRKLVQIQQNQIRGEQKLAQRSNRNLDVSRGGEGPPTGSGPPLTTDWHGGKLAPKKDSVVGGPSLTQKTSGFLSKNFLKLATAASVVAIGFALVGAAAFIATKAFQAVSRQIDGFISKVKKFSPAMLTAEAMGKVKTTLAAIELGRGDQAQKGAEIITARSDFGIAIMKFQAVLTRIFGPFIKTITEIGTTLVTAFGKFLETIAPVIEFVLFALGSILEFFTELISVLTFGFSSLVRGNEKKRADEDIFNTRRNVDKDGPKLNEIEMAMQIFGMKLTLPVVTTPPMTKKEHSGVIAPISTVWIPTW